MGNDWDGGIDDYELVDTGTTFAMVRRRPAVKSARTPGGLQCGHQEGDGPICRRKAPCPEHYPK